MCVDYKYSETKQDTFFDNFVVKMFFIDTKTIMKVFNVITFLTQDNFYCQYFFATVLVSQTFSTMTEQL